MASSLRRYLPFAPTTTALQATTYLLGISLFSISFLVFLNSSVSFVITDLIGVRRGVGDIVGTLGFVDELVALVACPAWGLASDRLGVRWVAVVGYAVIGAALFVFVAARNVYPQLLLARIFFAVGATAAATMVTAILPVLADEGPVDTTDDDPAGRPKPTRSGRSSVTLSMSSELTITPERYTRTLSGDGLDGIPAQGNGSSVIADDDGGKLTAKPSVLAGYVGLFTGCGALVALAVFLPLPARFGEMDGVTPARAVTYSFYAVGSVAFLVAGFVAVGLRNLRGEEGKGWKTLFGSAGSSPAAGQDHDAGSQHPKVLPYAHLLRSSIALGFADPQIGLGYLGGFVARASTVAISLFVPLFVNTFFMDNGKCLGSPNDPSSELKKECRAAYVLAAILTGVAQLVGLLCAPVFGYLSSRPGRFNYPVVAATVFGVVGYVVFPQLASPEPKDVEGRGGTPLVFLVVSLMGISQIGAIVCSLGSLGRGVLTADVRKVGLSGDEAVDGGEGGQDAEEEPLLNGAAAVTTVGIETVSRVRLKGSIAGVYSWCGGAAILLLTKVGGLLFDKWTHGAPFYMMAVFNGILLAASLAVDISRLSSKRLTR